VTQLTDCECSDIDECSRDAMLCRGGHCINTVGSFLCQCAEGHELVSDGTTCKGNCSLHDLMMMTAASVSNQLTSWSLSTV